MLNGWRSIEEHTPHVDEVRSKMTTGMVMQCVVSCVVVIITVVLLRIDVRWVVLQ